MPPVRWEIGNEPYGLHHMRPDGACVVEMPPVVARRRATWCGVLEDFVRQSLRRMERWKTI